MIPPQFQEYQKAIHLVANNFPLHDETMKPTMLHCMNVGTSLIRRRYERDIVLAGFLHDTLEDTEVSQEHLEEMFGRSVLDIVIANTADEAITDKKERKKDLIRRCVSSGKNAVIVKAADIFDNYHFYVLVSDTDEIQYCATMTTLLFAEIKAQQRQEVLNEPLLQELQAMLEKYPLV